MPTPRLIDLYYISVPAALIIPLLVTNLVLQCALVLVAAAHLIYLIQVIKQETKLTTTAATIHVVTHLDDDGALDPEV